MAQKYTWNDFFGGVVPNQEQIKALYDLAYADILEANRLTRLAQGKIQMLQAACRHPKKTGYVCPDCGFDTE